MKKLFSFFSVLLMISGFSQEIDSLHIPQLLISNSGKKIATVKQWEKFRRPEIIEMFKENMYGRIPETKYTLVTKLLEQSNTALNGRAIRKQVELKIFNTAKTDSVVAMLLIYLPKINGKAPLFLNLNYKGNHTVSVEPEVFINPNWINPEGAPANDSNFFSSEASRGKSKQPFDLMLSSGYGIATMHYGDFAPDNENLFQSKLIRLLYKPSQTTRKDNEWGSISAWAFGLCRAMDYLVSDPDIDEKKIVVEGGSRLGKAALWAAALDKRFAISISNESGYGGASLTRMKGGETISRAMVASPRFYCNNLKKFKDKEQDIPFDQHMLLAVIAPRPIYVASAEKDLWSNPPGEFFSAYLATEVYNLYELKSEIPKQMPVINSPLQEGYVGYHCRDGIHSTTIYDWQQFINFANKFFK